VNSVRDAVRRVVASGARREVTAPVRHHDPFVVEPGLDAESVAAFQAGATAMASIEHPPRPEYHSQSFVPTVGNGLPE
jgi:hypothetical protein